MDTKISERPSSITDLNDVKLNSGEKTSSVNDLFNDIHTTKTETKPENKKEELKTNKQSTPKKTTNTLFTVPVIVLMVLVVILILIIIYIIRKKLTKNDDLIASYEEQKEKILKENAELRKEINLNKQKMKMLNETNQELQDKLNENMHFNTDNHKPKSFKEHKADKWKVSNSYINDKKDSKLKNEIIIEEQPTTMKLEKKQNVTSSEENQNEKEIEQEEYIEDLLN